MNARPSDIPAAEVIDAKNLLGEGILWDSRRDVLWWTDIHGQTLHRHEWATRGTETLPAPERIGSFGLVAGSTRLITAFASGIAFYDPKGQQVDWLARPVEVEAGMRFNDGRVDRAGRFWTGTMVEDPACLSTGSLYSVGRSGEFRNHVRGVRITNGLCTSPDGKRLYFADSSIRRIWVYDLIEPDGVLENRRLFAETPDGAFPDGATIDADGCLWSAHWGASAVVRYTPEGRIDRMIALPTSQPSCVCFGGPDLDVLCVTTARVELDAATLHAEPAAGDVFLYRAGAQGLPEPEYRT